LQQDLPGHIFDCSIIPPRATQKGTDKAKAPVGPQKHKVLVAGARKQLLEEMQNAVRNSGLVPDHIVPGLVGPVNAFEQAMPSVFKNDVVALVDVGFKHSTICILNKGEMILSRTVAIGGDRLTTSLSESMTISYAEAEGIKIGMAHEVQQTLEATLTPLG